MLLESEIVSLKARRSPPAEVIKNDVTVLGEKLAALRKHCDELEDKVMTLFVSG